MCWTHKLYLPLSDSRYDTIHVVSLPSHLIPFLFSSALSSFSVHLHLCLSVRSHKRNEIGSFERLWVGEKLAEHRVGLGARCVSNFNADQSGSSKIWMVIITWRHSINAVLKGSMISRSIMTAVVEKINSSKLWAHNLRCVISYLFTNIQRGK